MTESDVLRAVRYADTKGKEHRTPLWYMMQVVNHSMYHHGQTTTMLRQLGAALVPTDRILFYREQQGDTSR